MLIPQSLDTKWYERATECANETIILSGGRVAFVEPDVNLGQVEVNINPWQYARCFSRILSGRWALYKQDPFGRHEKSGRV